MDEILTKKEEDTLIRLGCIYVIVWLLAMFLLGSFGVPYAMPLSLIFTGYIVYVRQIKSKKNGSSNH